MSLICFSLNVHLEDNFLYLLESSMLMLRFPILGVLPISGNHWLCCALCLYNNDIGRLEVLLGTVFSRRILEENEPDYYSG